jgi:predicted PurR-regulated permease PerM
MDRPDPLLPAKGATAASRLFTLVGFVVVVAGLYLGRRVLIPLSLSVVFAFLLTPVVAFVERSRIGRVPSVLTVLLLSFAIFALVGWGVTNQLVEILARLPDYKENIRDKIESIRAPGVGSFSKATATVSDIGKELSSRSETAATKNLAGNN